MPVLAGEQVSRCIVWRGVCVHSPCRRGSRLPTGVLEGCMCSSNKAESHVTKVFPTLGVNLGVRMMSASVEVVLPSPGPVL